MPSYFLAVLISPSYLYSFMHGATVEDEWCAKQNILLLHRVSISLSVFSTHHWYLFCLHSIHSFCCCTSILWKKKTTHLDILSSFCIGFWTKALHCWFGFICYHTATHCLGTALLWIITKWLWEGAEHLGVKANCCVLYIIIGLSAPFAQWHGSSLRLALEKGACLNTPSEVIRW